MTNDELNDIIKGYYDLLIRIIELARHDTGGGYIEYESAKTMDEEARWRQDAAEFLEWIEGKRDE